MTTTPPQDSERERFEAAAFQAAHPGLNFRRNDGESGLRYWNSNTDAMWRGWLARAALDTTTAQTEPPPPAITIHDEGCKCECPDHCVAGVLVSFGGGELDMRTAKCPCRACHRDPIP